MAGLNLTGLLLAGIVEEGEACDCGLPAHCVHRDPCCTPRSGGALAFEDGALHKEGCSVAPKATCHPSQGLCCSANCEYTNLTQSGIDCTLQEKPCNCPNMTSECRCGLGGRCLTDGTCHAAECALLGLRECKCGKGGPGGKLSKIKMCGVCCEVTSFRASHCVGVEHAASIIMALSILPSSWPDEDYIGPNTTLNLCKNDTCRHVQIRAWPSGDACVSMNAVGMCSPRGHCKMVVITPSANIYPDIMSVKAMTESTSICLHFKVDTLSMLISILVTILRSRNQ